MRHTLIVFALLASALSSTALAQTPPAQPSGPAARRPPARRTPPPPAYPNGLQLRGFAVMGQTWFTAGSTFDAVLGSKTGIDYGGGLSVTDGPGYIEIGARRFKKDGERVFVTDNGQVFRLGIPTSITMTPLDITAGWRFRPWFAQRLRPHVGVGYTRLRYEETADFAQDGDDVKESFNGFHLVGGGEFRLHRLVGLTAEVAWTSIANAIGEGGASKAFDEDNLGGTSARLKLVIGR